MRVSVVTDTVKTGDIGLMGRDDRAAREERCLKRTLQETQTRSSVSHCWARGERIRAAIRNQYVPRLARYIHRLTDEYTTMYIHRLTNECMGLYLSVETIFFGSYTEGCITVIFLSTKEYKITEECTMFFCSGIIMKSRVMDLVTGLRLSASSPFFLLPYLFFSSHLGIYQILVSGIIVAIATISCVS
jgi:hypothetical protein